MRSLVPIRAPLLILTILQAISAATLAAQETRVLTGRVVDQSTRQPIGNVVVKVQHPQLELAAITSEDGRFRIEGVPVGLHVLGVEHLAYGERLQPLVVQSETDPTVEIRLEMRPVSLPAVVVEGRTELEQRRISTGFAMNEVQRPDIEDAARRGMTLWELLREEMPQVAVREASRGIAACVEFRGAISSSGGCQHMAIFVDGVNMSAPGTIYPNIPLNDIERVEAISPGQAGVQWGTLGGAGVLLIETRTGPRPTRGPRMQENYIFGFDWSAEAQPYPWPRVVGSSVLANALGLGIGVVAAHQCLELDDRSMLGVQDGCGGLKALAAGALALGLPVFATGFATRWSGSTERSRGRLLPSVILGSASAVTGYLLIIDGKREAGSILLGVGIPVTAMLSDRIFRVLR